MWVWGDVGSHVGCPCAVADRFLVVDEAAPVRWRQSADVMVGRPRPTVSDALRAADAWWASAPGCGLVTVPVGETGTVFRTRAEQVFVRRGPQQVCGVCAYPWLVAGYRFTDLVEQSSVAGVLSQGGGVRRVVQLCLHSLDCAVDPFQVGGADVQVRGA